MLSKLRCLCLFYDDLDVFETTLLRAFIFEYIEIIKTLYRMQF